MDARSRWIAAVMSVTIAIVGQVEGQTYQANSENFVVYAASAQLAKKASILAEQYRKKLSNDWLGYEIEKWSEKCPIHVQVGPHAGGETSFAFVRDASGRSRPVSWQMKIYGPVDRLLDAVLPHEVTHTIFATHFGRPLPRWADEGACTTVEHESERAKNHQMLLSFLSSRPSRGIPFNRMFTMKQYPHDILPLYAQGYSVARYLIAQKGRQHFVQFLEKGMNMEQSNYDTGAWDQATQEFYDYKNLSDLQLAWEQWVRAGSQEQTLVNQQIAANDVVTSATDLVDPKGTYAIAKNQSWPNPLSSQIDRMTPDSGPLNSWYARESRSKQAVTIESRGNKSKTPFRPGSLRRLDQSTSESTKTTLWR